MADWVRRAVKQRGHEAYLIDPAEHTELQVFTDQYKTAENPSEDFTTIQHLVQSADGYIAVTPEYNHSYSGALKNMLDCFLEEYNRKCFGIVTYSAGPFGGIRAAEHLRCVTAELGAVATPTALSISSVQNTFDVNGDLIDEAYDRRLSRMLDEFEWFVEALGSARNQ